MTTDNAGGAAADGANGAAAGNGAASSVSGDSAAAANGAAANNAAATSKNTNGQPTGDNAAASNAAQADWRDGLDGELKDFAARLQSPHDAVKVALDLRKANGSMIRVPGKDAKPEDIAKFHKAIGVPEKAEDYKIDLGREMSEQDKATVSEITKAFHKHAVPAEAASAVSKAVVDIANAQLAAANEVAKGKREEAVATLRKELGGDFDKNVNMAVRAVEVFGGAEAREWLNSTIVDGAKLGDHPMFIRMFGKIGLRMGEGEFIGAVNQGERSSLQDELNKIMSENPPGTDKYKQPHIQRRIAELNSALYGNAPVVGAAGRAV